MPSAVNVPDCATVWSSDWYTDKSRLLTHSDCAQTLLCSQQSALRADNNESSLSAAAGCSTDNFFSVFILKI